MEVSVQSSLTRAPVVLKPVVANNCAKTQISRRLAKKLGLNSVRDVYIIDDMGMTGDRNAYKWRISLQPIVITVFGLERNNTRVVFPLINWMPEDAYWEMIIGQDCPEFGALLGYNMTRYVRGEVATGGPRYDPDIHFMGHNVRMCRMSDFAVPPNEFFEYLCFDSEAISRLAINFGSSEMAVVFDDSTTIYLYSNVPKHHLQAIDSGASKGTTINAVKETCSYAIIENFPKACLMNIEKD